MPRYGISVEIARSLHPKLQIGAFADHAVRHHRTFVDEFYGEGRPVMHGHRHLGIRLGSPGERGALYRIDGGLLRSNPKWFFPQFLTWQVVRRNGSNRIPPVQFKKRTVQVHRNTPANSLIEDLDSLVALGECRMGTQKQGTGKNKIANIVFHKFCPLQKTHKSVKV